MTLSEHNQQSDTNNENLVTIPVISLGDRMKEYEKTDRVPPYQSFIIRADGHSFSKYTSGFPKPFDAGFCRTMVKTANSAMLEFKAMTAFVCSDEITLLFSPECTKEEYEKHMDLSKNIPTHIFSGRHNKIETLVSSKCSVMFNKFMLEEAINCSMYDKKTFEKISSCEATFDARMIPIPVGCEIEAVNNIIWRSSYDCYRNTISAYGRHILGHKICFGKNCNQMIEMMKEKNFDHVVDIPMWYKYGILCKKILVTLKTTIGEEYIRTKMYNFTTNLLEQDRDKTLELFFAKYFEDLIGSDKYDLIL